MNPHLGISPANANASGYRYVSPHGDSGFRPTANYSLLTANSSFTFSAKERDPETGYSYFGSRYYSSDLSIWLSVDPMAAKYPSLSPYVYCANNPVKLVDPNGEEIIIEWGGMKCYYSEGRLYTDREFKNEYVAEEGSFFYNVQTTLNTIADTKTGNTLVNELANDKEFKVKIIEGEDSGFDPLTKSRDPYNEANAKITWNRSGGLVPTEKGMLQNGVTSLAHELCHGYDYMKNTFSTDAGPGIYGDIKICDWKAVYHENQIRQELGLPLRTHYNKNKAQTKGIDSPVLHDGTPFLPPGISPLF
jgi:RHS repeat-associated protein